MFYKRSVNAVTADLGDGHLAVMGLSRGRYYTLNATGKVIWTFLETPRSAEDIEAHVQSCFDIDTDTCLQDSQKFLADLVAEGLVERV
ncbi:MAG TPA: PqqD family protein [Verrucomicrobiae bacterium]|nr:PqqD family protein [Verrucomicrobiae bacterium]